MHQQARSHLYDALKWTLMTKSAKYEMYYDGCIYKSISSLFKERISRYCRFSLVISIE